ncbi:MAG: hypothetical protein K2M80_06805, partial [Muribaculaceae bacterium]|nr:hypothetical protein [Muribaculaceae bacterium]
YPVKYLVNYKLNAPQKLILNHYQNLVWHDNKVNDVYTPHLQRHQTAPNQWFNFPGGASDGHNNYGQEMYDYKINKSKGLLKVLSVDNNVKIDKISINGEQLPLTDDGLYKFDCSVSPSVSVNYTLFDKYPLTTSYSNEFNAALPDSDLFVGIEQSAIDYSAPVKIYDLKGNKVYEGNVQNQSFKGKVYIVVQNNVAKSIYFNN